MPYHVPFAHRRHRGAGRPGPIYIGFDEPVSIQRRRGRFNWMGFTGLMMALVSPLTAFVLAPFALIFCLLGLRRSPRGMAVVGTVLSLAATTILSLIIFGVASHQVTKRQAREQAAAAHQLRIENSETRATLAAAIEQLRDYRAENEFHLPNALDGNILTVQLLDAWETELRYETNPEGCIVRSAGRDRQFNTGDDLTAKLDGQTSDDPYSEPLSPVNR